jgi:hypothetical protein
MAQNDRALIEQLKNHGVEFIVIGGVCGVLRGVPLVTFDLAAKLLRAIKEKKQRT